MITNKVEEARNWDYTDHLACEHCGRTNNLRRIFVKNGIKARELCYCEVCWTEIMNSVWPFQDWRRKC